MPLREFPVISARGRIAHVGGTWLGDMEWAFALNTSTGDFSFYYEGVELTRQ